MNIVWRANYELSIPGSYTAAVHTLLQDASEESILLGQSCVDQNFEDPIIFEWTQYSATENFENTWKWANESQENYTSVKYQSIDIFTAELSTYKTKLRSDYAIPYSYLKDNVPYVHFHELGNHVKTSKICMFGDSQMRTLLNSVIVRVDKSASCLPHLENTAMKVQCEHQGFYYNELHYPNDLSFSPEIQSCTHIFINSGQWPSGPPTIPPWTPPKYRVEIRYLIQNTIIPFISKHPHVKLTWISTYPHPIGERMRMCPPADWRFPHVVGAYNSIVREEICSSNASISYLDMTPLVLPLLDISFDQSHFHGPVGRALAKRFANHVLGRGGGERIDCATKSGGPAAAAEDVAAHRGAGAEVGTSKRAPGREQLAGA